MDKLKLTEAADDDLRLLEVLIPGKSPAIQKVRTQIAGFASTTSPSGVLLLGPVGSGKSTIARVMAFMRYLHFCSIEKRRQIMEKNIKFDAPFRIDKKFLNWFEEINLTGLVESLAQSQLFGIARGTATNVIEKAGIFEQAMRGHVEEGTEVTKEAQITGGVVFLDEVGDLPINLQPILLTVMTGTEVFRVGGEGKTKYGYTYTGSIIGATWQEPNRVLRPDLLSRLSNYRIVLPGLNERRDELPEIVKAIEGDINSRHLQRLDRLNELSPDPIARTKLETARHRTLKLKISEIDELAEQDWETLGDLRGLRQILERCFLGNEPLSAIITEFRRTHQKSTKNEYILAAMMAEEVIAIDKALTLTEALKSIERRTREKFVDCISNDHLLLQRLCGKFETTEPILKRQMADFTRDRSKRRR